MSKNKPICWINNRSLEIVKAFVQKGADFNEFGGSATYPIFHHFIYRSDAEKILSYLVENNKININGKDLYGQTIFHKAVQQGKVDLIEFLLKKKADINTKDKQGQTPLAIAKQHRQELVAWLMEYGAIL